MEYKNNGPIPFKPRGTDTDAWANFRGFSNVKFFVINNP